MLATHSYARASDHTRPRSAAASLRAIVAAIRDGLRHHQERRRLAALGDDLLRDIGLTRGDVEREYERPFWSAIDHAALNDIRRRSGPRLGSGGGDRR
ncbi:MAG: DUF1127 domain-containing protein [Geminicoccaceae bacterium]